MKKVIVITGPTAVGKTKCSIEIARKLKTDIINADAYQIYKKMDIGTAKPNIDEQSLVKHHLIDIVEPTCCFSVADYQKIVREKIEELWHENKVPLLVGGSGLYLDSVISNYEFGGQTHDSNFDEKYQNYTNSELHEQLEKLDINMANSIHQNNRKRVLRALEILESGQTKGQKKNELIYDALVIYLNDDREKLYNRINLRVDKMINDGLLDEVKYLFSNNLFSKTSIAAIGYKELIPYYLGDIELTDAILKIKQASRNYAKRQLTWFNHKNYTSTVLIDENNFNNTIDEVYALIEKFLAVEER